MLVVGCWIWGFPWFKYFGTLTVGQFLKLIWEPNAFVELEKRAVPRLNSSIRFSLQEKRGVHFIEHE